MALCLLSTSFVAVMLVGAALSYYMTPETCDMGGKSRKLEDLAKGKAHRKLLEQEERESAEPRRKPDLNIIRVPIAPAENRCSCNISNTRS